MKKIEPLRVGRKSIADQAKERNEPVPINVPVSELSRLGYDVDPEWPEFALIEEDSDSPTGYVIVWRKDFDEQNAMMALAT